MSTTPWTTWRQSQKCSRRISTCWSLNPLGLAVMTDQQHSVGGAALAGENLPTLEGEGLHRRLGQRQLTMMAIGGGDGECLVFGSRGKLRPVRASDPLFYLLGGGVSSY